MSKMAETDFTIEWLIKKLKTKFNVEAELTKWNCQRIALGDGFASILALVEFEWKNECRLPNSALLKIPHSEKALDVVERSDSSLDEIIKQFHHNEIAAYVFLQGLDDSRIAKLYHSENIDSDTPILVMEYYHKSCTASVADGLNLNQMLQVVDTLAKVHAHSLTETAWVDTIIDDRNDFDQAWNAFIPIVKKVIIPLDPEYFGEKFEKLTDILEPEYSYHLMRHLHEKLGLPPVLVHGDMWVNNILWEKSPTGKAGDKLLAIVDWQICHAGNCCEDIARLMANIFSFEMRRAKTDEILSFYHRKLTEYMKGDPPFSLDKVKEIYNEMLPVSLVLLMILIPFWLKGSAYKGENSELYMTQKVNDLKMMIEEVLQLKEC